MLALVPAGARLPPYTESAIQTAADYPEVQKALNGEVGSFVRDAGNGSMVLSVAVPVQRYRQVLGALFLTKNGDSVENTLRDTMWRCSSVFKKRSSNSSDRSAARFGLPSLPTATTRLLSSPSGSRR